MIRKDGYIPVGPSCVPFESHISIDDVYALRDIVMWEFFDQLPVKTQRLSEDADKTMCAKGFHRAVGDDDLPGIFMGAMLHHPDEATSRLIVMQTKLRRARHNNAQQRIESRLTMEVYNHQLVEAVRRVRIVRGVGELTVAAVEHQMEEDTETGYITMQRRAYERHMTPADCELASEALRRTILRARVS